MTTKLLLRSIFCTCLCLPAFAQPRIDALQNNYSYLTPDNPNYGIARGSIFIIYGANLANSTTGLQSSTQAPFLQTTLDGVSAQVTVGGVTTDVIWYYLTPNQLGGILPSATPAGDGFIVVNNNGQTSAPAPIHVVNSAFGVLTLNGTGAGAAAVYDANYNFLTESNSAKPGDTIQLFGTGLGPVNEAETMQQPAQNLPEVPITVEIAGTPAAVSFRGRIFPGLDQINVVIPALVQQTGISKSAFTQYGCELPVNVRIGNYGSNLTTIPVSANGGDCPPPVNPGGGGGSTSDLSISQAEKNQWIAAGQYRQGGLGLTRQVSYSINDDIITGQTTTTVERSDVLSASFNRITGPDLANMFNTNLPGVFAPQAGECSVTVGFPQNPLPNLTYTSLDAGPYVSVQGGNGTRSAQRTTQVNTFSYSENIGAGVPGNYLDAGVYTLSGPGGPDVGSFSGSLTVAPELLWANRESVAVVDRSQPLPITWDGGEPSTLVSVQGSSFVSTNGIIYNVSFTCWANNPDKQLIVPVSVLTQLPASGRINAGEFSFLQRGSLAVASVGTGVRMFATGVDYLTGGNQWGISQSTEYK